MKENRFLIVHCSDSAWGSRATVERWHKLKGWRAIGYNYLILNPYPTYDSLKHEMPQPAKDGRVIKGRDLDRDGNVDEEVGAHALGYNGNSIGICVIGKREEDGKTTFTPLQMLALYDLLMDKCLQENIPVENILGHCETERAGGKTCPEMDMDLVRQRVAERLSQQACVA